MDQASAHRTCRASRLFLICNMPSGTCFRLYDIRDLMCCRMALPQSDRDLVYTMSGLSYACAKELSQDFVNRAWTHRCTFGDTLVHDRQSGKR